MFKFFVKAWSFCSKPGLCILGPAPAVSYMLRIELVLYSGRDCMTSRSLRLYGMFMGFGLDVKIADCWEKLHQKKVVSTSNDAQSGVKSTSPYSNAPFLTLLGNINWTNNFWYH